MNDDSRRLRARILELVRQFSELSWPETPFVPGQSPVPVSGKVFDADDVELLVDSALDFWLTTGRFAADFEKRFASFMDVRHAALVNSGSSANLVAVTALTSDTLGDRKLRPGDEIITPAAGFPTTVNPILQNRLVPVFIDIELPTYNLDPAALEAACSDRTRAIIAAHTLGNPFDLDSVTECARRHDLWLIEDCCDAVGARYRSRPVGSFGDVATTSFYPAHHITMGEGGCVLTGSAKLAKTIRSLRDWGRDCWCDPGRDNTCGKRFEWQLGSLPLGYDHKYIYSEIGYNLKVTDMQAAVGVAQLDKLPAFIAARRRNFELLRDGLADLAEFLILPEPTADAEPSWFGFPITVRESSPHDRNHLVRALDRRRIGTRLLFAGNILHQPAYRGIECRTVGGLENTNRVMHQTFWIGVYPGLSPHALDYVIEVFHSLFKE